VPPTIGGGRSSILVPFPPGTDRPSGSLETQNGLRQQTYPGPFLGHGVRMAGWEAGARPRTPKSHCPLSDAGDGDLTIPSGCNANEHRASPTTTAWPPRSAGWPRSGSSARAGARRQSPGQTEQQRPCQESSARPPCPSLAAVRV